MGLLASPCFAPASNVAVPADMHLSLTCPQSFIMKTDLEGLEQACQEDHEGRLQSNKTMMDVSLAGFLPDSSCACLRFLLPCWLVADSMSLSMDLVMACCFLLSVHDRWVLSLACCFVLSIHDRWSAFPERFTTFVA